MKATKEEQEAFSMAFLEPLNKRTRVLEQYAKEEDDIVWITVRGKKVAIKKESKEE